MHAAACAELSGRRCGNGASPRDAGGGDSTADGETNWSTVAVDERLVAELVAGTPQQRNWRGIGIALLVIATMCGIILAAVVLFTPGFSVKSPNPVTLQLEDLWDETLVPVTSGAAFIPLGERRDGALVYRDANHSLLLVNLTAGGAPTTHQLASVEPFNLNNPVHEWLVSADGRFVVFGVGRRQRWVEHPEHPTYRILDVDAATYERVGPKPATGGAAVPVEHFAWGTAAGAADLAFVHERNVWYQAAPAAAPAEVTHGRHDYVYHGAPDWLYEQEIWPAGAPALWWSPDGRQLAFARFDDRKVPMAHMSYYGSAEPYPNIGQIPYPKAGFPLPEVQLYIWHKPSNTTQRVRPPAKVELLRDYYLLSASWLRGSLAPPTGDSFDQVFVAVWANRWQNVTYISFCAHAADRCVLNYEQPYTVRGVRGWATSLSSSAWLAAGNGGGYFALLPEAHGGNVYAHAARVSMPRPLHDVFSQFRIVADGAREAFQRGRPAFWATGAYDVVEIHAYRAGRLYYTAAAPERWHRHVHWSDGAESRCLTCGQVAGCDAVRATFADAGHSPYYTVKCLGPRPPSMWLRSIDDELLAVQLEDNVALAAYLNTLEGPVELTEHVQLADNREAVVRLVIPPNVDRTESAPKELLPLVVKAYTGPDTQQVTDTFAGVTFDHYVAARRRYAVAMIDAAGSAGGGWSSSSPVRGHLTTVDVHEQLAVVERLLLKHKYLHMGKVAIWGWAYGGTVATAAAELTGGSVFRCAAAVAPVSDMRLHAAAYAERYMGPLNENPVGYARTSLVRNVSRLADLRYLLAHGTADTSVHFMHTVLLARELTRASVDFRLMIYPNDGHALLKSQKHLYTSLDNFFIDCFHTDPIVAGRAKRPNAA